jgi:hypothetical protein
MDAVRSATALLAAIALFSALPMGCASNPPGTGTSPPAPPSAPSGQNPSNSGPSAGQRAQGAVEGMLVGAIIGAQAGPIGAAVGGTALLVYGALTGHAPFQGGPGRGGGGRGGLPPAEAEREEELERQIEYEVARQDSLEAEIEAELRRQEELLRQIERDEALRTASESWQEPSEGELVARVDPRSAPRVPEERDLPLSIFDEQRRTIPKGTWSNDRELQVIVRSLDADRDGNPEEIRYHDAASDMILRKENDTNYDGSIDTWTLYEAGVVVEIWRDNSGNGKPDEWERYGRDGHMQAREVDRNFDGNPDAFFLFAGGVLVEERHDGNHDGNLARIVHYAERRIVRTEEDTTGDGRIDTWTHFQLAGDQEVVERVERDTTGDGRTDTFDYYEQLAGQTVLKQRDEDKNGDGEIDIRSIYEGGKLKQREIRDPALLPL